MVKLYDSYLQEVIKILKPITCIPKRQLLGGWTLELTHKNNEAGATIQVGNYIECKTPKGLQKFKVKIIDKINENTLRITAFHRMYDLANNYVKDTNIVNKTRKQAVEQILANTLRPTSFKVIGHGTNTNNLRIVGQDPFNAIVSTSQDNTVINRYGGEWDFDNDTVIIEDYIGQDRGYTVSWNKNMIELNETMDDTGLITQIVPVGKERLMLPELTVNSLYIDSYDSIYTKEIAFSDICVDEEKGITEAEAHRLLRLAAEKYFRETECDKVKANYSVSIKDVKNNPKYQECSFFYVLDIGDFVTIQKSNGLRLKVRLLEYEYDSLKDEFIRFTLNGVNNKLTSNTTGIQGALDKILNTNGSLNSEKLEGLINMLTVSMGAMVDSAEKHRAKAILFEDRIPSSPTYGAMAVGTKGFMIASEFNASKNDWNWRTFGTGKGFVADLIIAGIIKGAGEDLVINLDTGEVKFKRGLIEGLNMKIDLNTGEIVSDYSNPVTGRQKIILHEGKLYSDLHLSVEGKESVFINSQKDNGDIDSYLSLVGIAMMGSDVDCTLSAPKIYLMNGSDNTVARVTGDFIVSGNKNCVQETSNYGKRLFYSVEDGQSWLTETGEDTFTVIKTESGTYERVILINNIYKECVNLNIPYIVEIYKESFGDFRIKEKTKDYFIIESDRLDFTFKYCIKAKRKNFENENLEEYTEIKEDL